MTIKETLKLVQFLHSAYPQDRKATQAELAQRVNTYNVMLADYDIEDVMQAAERCVATSKWHPSPQELLEAVKWVRLTQIEAPPNEIRITPCRVFPLNKDLADEYIDALCEWLTDDGDGSALDEFFKRHPETLEPVRRFWKNED